MSKTYKTDPTWVKLRRPSKAREEFHSHEDGICNFTDWHESGQGFYSWLDQACGYTVNYYGFSDGFFTRPKSTQIYRHEHQGRDRAQWRKMKHDMLKLSSEDLKDYDVQSYQHRHSALWEAY